MIIARFYIRFICIIIYLERHFLGKYNNNLRAIAIFFSALLFVVAAVSTRGIYPLHVGYYFWFYYAFAIFGTLILLNYKREKYFDIEYQRMETYMDNLILGIKKKMKNFFSVLILMITLGSCSYHSNSNVKSDKKYFCSPIGWTYSIPESWDLIYTGDLELIDSLRKTILSENIYIHKDISVFNGELQNLLAVERDTFNKLVATLELFDTTEFNFQNSVNASFNTIVGTYINKGHSVVNLDKGMTKISEIPFYFLKFDLESSERNLHQCVFLGLINDLNLTITSITDNEEDLNTVLSSIYSSTFNGIEK
jgi:hypothetical protein